MSGDIGVLGAIGALVVYLVIIIILAMATALLRVNHLGWATLTGLACFYLIYKAVRSVRW